MFLRCLLDWAGFLHQTGAPPQKHAVEPSSSFRKILASSHVSHSALVKQLAGSLIDAYFLNYHVVYPFIHEATFRAQYYEVVPRPPKKSWDMLYHAIIALGAWTVNHDQVGLEDYLYRRALTVGQDESVLEAASLSSVQALVLLSNLSQKRNSPNTGWNLLGLAVRTALSLALHRELPHWNISLIERESRRRVWWGLYVFDSGASTTFGRAVMLPDQDSMSVHHALNINDEVKYPVGSKRSYTQLTRVRHLLLKLLSFPSNSILQQFILHFVNRVASTCTPTTSQTGCWLNLVCQLKQHSHSILPWRHGRTWYPCTFSCHIHHTCQPDGMFSQGHDYGGGSGTSKSSSFDKSCFVVQLQSAARFLMRQPNQLKTSVSGFVWMLRILLSLRYTSTQ